MKNKIITSSIIVLFCLFSKTLAQTNKSYIGVCDASGGIKIGSNHILVAEDENDELLLYSISGKTNKIIRRFDLSFLRPLGKETQDKLESDFEGMTKLGNRVYAITSHGRDGKGRFRENRYGLFAIDISGEAENLTITRASRYNKLLIDMLEANNWDSPNDDLTNTLIERLRKRSSLSVKKEEELAPKDKGINIEALTIHPNGKGLLIGFRNPRTKDDKHAIIVHLKNPNEVLDENKTAKFGKPVFLNLNDLAIRSMEYSEIHNKIFILAGPKNKNGGFKIYSVQNIDNPIPRLISDTSLKFSEVSSPEGLIIHKNKLQILMDEGTKEIDKSECKDITAVEYKSFIDQWIDLPN